MIYLFEDFELDTARVELRTNGVAIAIEPQVFALLCFLVESRDRVATKEEIVARVWNGRVISDSAIASRIKSARRALGDDGGAQRLIRTIHGIGFRFVADVRLAATRIESIAPTAETAPDTDRSQAVETSRPSIAVLPFRLLGAADPQFSIGDALPHDLITELSRLRWLFVIARGSSFRFRGAEPDVGRVRTALNVRYCLSGVVEIHHSAMIISVELSDAEDSGVVWSERFRTQASAVHEIREEIVRAVINALELQIPLNEARRARLKSPERLDAWSAYHLGLHHMYRFNKADNSVATALFERAAAMEPGFARAYAGLSFTHFQSAFLSYADNVSEAANLAQRAAEQSLERDPVDPFGNFTMGRAFWLCGDLDASLPWLERANALNPNYAQAKYSRAWAQALLGNAASSRANVDEALALSPLDPLLYGMFGVRAFSHLVMGESAEAAEWAERAARSPGAHALIEMIAVLAHGLNGNDARAKAWARSARARVCDLNKAAFLRAFPFRDQLMLKRVSDELERFGF
ncbi:transcriptional regulator domain protein [Methylocella silvestris BL2]|uniref:Transcriptional regulator domain protein n=1 Tax=Methylocella silvestris (strain DSM 15510 / CIP 108128 / LMG 27833 / NCIMB 13906 / BL2) TaxID=395965 RepID=B8ESP8_METSB|nr:winged helix-turn-helix domain-containing protein [Methylocella silvestris]ACK50383.1 transcriptional regulator domain protein [Methylocella silvestris BL2]